ncbi:MAG TPA: 2-dehydropantoate 2-reductase [Acidimicrobiales bacterium]|nr:2-dehydropantoate 2-reductase [Acidimicrobiales bacterium]
MRFVVYGPGAIGGVVGGGLHRAGHQVTLIARGAHRDAIASGGLVLELPGERLILDVPVVSSPVEVDWSGNPAVLVAVKSQDTSSVLDALVAAAPPDTVVACLQNGVDNERRFLRHFANTYAVCVMCPATHLRPGVVQAHSAPVTALLDIGRYPSGADGTAEAIAEALRSAGADSVVRADIMRWKYRKLVMNVLNAVDALCGQAARRSDLARCARAEAEECLRRAGIDVASPEEDRQRRGDLLSIQPTASGPHGGSSSWQSLVRGGRVEADFLNGEIVLLGRLTGFATPVNALLQRLAAEQAATGRGPGSWSPEELLARAQASGGD